MKITLIQAILVGLWYWFAWWGGMRPFWPVSWNATFCGLVMGLIFHDVKQGIILGGTIQTIYLAHIGGGGNLLSDQPLAACLAIPIALSQNLSADVALTMATAFGLLGGLLDNIQRTAAGFIHRQLDKVIDGIDEKMNLKKLFLVGAGENILLGLLVRFPLVFLVVYFGSSADEILAILPPFVLTAFSTMGKLLPGVGMLMVATLIGRDKLVPFFVIGFFAMRCFGLTLLTMAIFGACIAIIYTQCTAKQDKPAAAKAEPKAEVSTTGKLSFGERAWTAIQLMTNYRMGICFEYLNGVGICLSMAPTMKKIYKDNLEGFKAALHRHNEPYVSDVIIGGSIFGVVVNMEEQIAAGEEVDPEFISTFKSSLMGPMAGFGDSIIQTILSPIVRTLFLPFALEGSIIGAMMEPVLRAICLAIGVFSFNLGYTSGKGAMTKMLRGGQMDNIMTGAGVLGMFILGAMASNYTKITLNVTWMIQETEMSLQKILDGVLPGVVPFTFLVICYYALRKGAKFTNIVLGVLVASFILAIVGIV